MGNSYVPEPIWKLWLAVDKALGSAVKLGGIYANKSGYHNTREHNEQRWPGNYSIELELDQLGPDDKAAALDLTFPKRLNMWKYTRRLKNAMLAGDPRMASVKEFYGTLNSITVYGLGKKSRSGKPYRTSADKSHLWHIHISFFRADVMDESRIMAVYEVLIGKPAPKGSSSKPAQPVHNSGDWTKDVIMSLPLIKKGSRGSDARRAQSLLAANGYPPAHSFNSKGEPDGIAGSGTDSATRRFQKARGLAVDGMIGKHTWTKLLGE